MATLAEMFPDARCELNHETPFELLIATILSAQCTDKRVNMITERLFAKYNTPEAIVSLSQEELEELIRDCGLFRSKAKNILATCRILLEQYGGEVPQTLEELVKLPGVGRKTANVVISNAFGVPAIAVDTHVFRVANRLGLAKSDNVDEVEQQLMRRLPKSQWTQAHHQLIFLGRYHCTARNPKCEGCPLLEFCPHGKAALGRAAKGSTSASRRQKPSG